MAFRSLLDASYGLVPGSACIHLTGADEQLSPPLSFVVSLSQYSSVNATIDSSRQFITLDEFISDSLQLSNKTNQWVYLPLDQCSNAALLLSSQEDPESLHLCDQTSEICISADVPSTVRSSATCSSVKHLRFLHSISSLSESCTYGQGKSLNVTDLLMMPSATKVSCTMSLSPTKEVCTATIGFLQVEAFHVRSPQSSWVSTEGRETREFRQAPHMTDFNVSHICIRQISAFVTNTSQAVLREAIHIRARAYLTSFISEHNIAFTMTNGPATDLANFLALIVSTAISVMMAISDPFTEFFLRAICRRRPHHLDSSRGKVRQVLKVLFQVLCNVLLSLSSFLPVLYVTWSELQREQPFFTWNVGSSDQYIYSPTETQVRVRVVYLLSASSKYASQFVIASSVVVCSSCILVGVCSARRCKQILDRYTLLQKFDSIRAGIGPVIRKDIEEDRETLIERSLRATYMTEAECLTIKRQVNLCSIIHDRTQEEQAVQLYSLMTPHTYVGYGSN